MGVSKTYLSNYFISYTIETAVLDWVKRRRDYMNAGAVFVAVKFEIILVCLSLKFRKRVNKKEGLGII